MDIVGCTPDELRQHIESQFVEGMSFDNMNIWHLDRIMPISLAETQEEAEMLCYYTNLQPLFAEDKL